MPTAYPHRAPIAGVYAGECTMANVPAVWLLRVSHWALDGRNDCSSTLNHEASLLADRLDPPYADIFPAEYEEDAPLGTPGAAAWWSGWAE